MNLIFIWCWHRHRRCSCWRPPRQWWVRSSWSIPTAGTCWSTRLFRGFGCPTRPWGRGSPRPRFMFGCWMRSSSSQFGRHCSTPSWFSNLQTKPPVPSPGSAVSPSETRFLPTCTCCLCPGCFFIAHIRPVPRSSRPRLPSVFWFLKWVAPGWCPSAWLFPWTASPTKHFGFWALRFQSAWLSPSRWTCSWDSPSPWGCFWFHLPTVAFRGWTGGCCFRFPCFSSWSAPSVGGFQTPGIGSRQSASWRVPNEPIGIFPKRFADCWSRCSCLSLIGGIFVSIHRFLSLIGPRCSRSGLSACSSRWAGFGFPFVWHQQLLLRRRFPVPECSIGCWSGVSRRLILPSDRQATWPAITPIGSCGFFPNREPCSSRTRFPTWVQCFQPRSSAWVSCSARSRSRFLCFWLPKGISICWFRPPWQRSEPCADSSRFRGFARWSLRFSVWGVPILFISQCRGWWCSVSNTRFPSPICRFRCRSRSAVAESSR